MPDYDAIIRQAKYIAPSGAEFVLMFDDLERTGAKKSAVHELPQQSVPIVQDLGNQSGKYPMAVYFSGEDCYTQADAFFSALGEAGPGTLEHPMFGNLDVLPLSWGETRKLVDGLGRVDFSVEFVQAPKIVALSSSTAASSAENLNRSVDDAMDASATAAAGDFAPGTAADKLKTKNNLLRGVSAFADSTREIASGVAEVSTSINRQVRVITNTIDDLIGAPLELFNALATLAKTPATIVTGVSRKIAAYHEQALVIFASIPASYAQAVASVESLLYALGGASQASTVGDLASRADAIAAADSLDSLGFAILQHIEATEAAVPGYRPNPEVVAALVAAASDARASLVERAYSLKTERRLTLDTEMDPISLIAMLYGATTSAVPDLDAALDSFIASNGLIGNEIFLVPAGREVVYYV